MHGQAHHPRYGEIPFVADSNSHEVRTPGPGRASDPAQKLVVQFVSYLNRRDSNPEKLAADLALQPVEIQEQLAKFVFACLGHWSEFGEFTQPSHPLAHVYATARKMVNNLFR